jgi:hypothetical protein
MSWHRPKRILLLTYERADHIGTSYDQSVVGVPDLRASITKARRVFRGDWVLIRASDVPRFVASRPARVTGRPVEQRTGSSYPDLLWEAEREAGRVLYPLRIPVTFDGGPQTKPGCINWETLAALGFRGKDGFVLETPQQWGKKFTTNIPLLRRVIAVPVAGFTSSFGVVLLGSQRGLPGYPAQSSPRRIAAQIGAHLRGHLLQFDRRPAPALTADAGARLLLTAALLEVLNGAQIVSSPARLVDSRPAEKARPTQAGGRPLLNFPASMRQATG